MRFLSITILAVIVSTSAIASADTYRRDDRKDRRDDRRDRREQRPVVRDNRTYNRPVVRDNRTYNRPVVRDNRTYSRPRYQGPVRANRRVIERRPLYVNNSGRFTFHNGRTVVYTRPVIRERYYDVRVRPQIIVENYPSQYGYIWVSGAWGWNGGEWQWTSGHYDADPSFGVYYDDDSWDD
jgi:hypothetical protein